MRFSGYQKSLRSSWILGSRTAHSALAPASGSGVRTAHSDLGLAIGIVVAADGVQVRPFLVAVCRM